MEVRVNNLNEIREYLNKMPASLFEDVREVFKDATLDTANDVKENITSRLNNRTGALRRSINTSLTGTSIDTLRASVFSSAGGGANPVIYAPVHERGATIRAKKAYTRVQGGPYLNIPLSANKTPSGVMRLTAKMVFQQGGYIRGRSVWLGNQAMFALVKQVTIPARLGMVESAENQVPTILSRLSQMIGV